MSTYKLTHKMNEINHTIDGLSKSLKETFECARQAIENSEHPRKLIYKIKYTILANAKLSDGEKVAQLVELLAHECPHGTEGKTS